MSFQAPEKAKMFERFFMSDGASIFTSTMFTDFCKSWGVEQRISSAYHATSNKRADLAVKHAKRLVQDSLGPGGTLDTDSMARALLAHRNTPDPPDRSKPSPGYLWQDVKGLFTRHPRQISYPP